MEDIENPNNNYKVYKDKKENEWIYVDYIPEGIAEYIPFKNPLNNCGLFELNN
jgi:hypothetical protein